MTYTTEIRKMVLKTKHNSLYQICAHCRMLYLADKGIWMGKTQQSLLLLLLQLKAAVIYIIIIHYLWYYSLI